MADPSRLEELRRRVQRDPASLAFAQLAEEHRRAGRHQDAVRVCRAGLRHHPEYHSARVTLGRALLALGDLDAAGRELGTVLHAAPENLAAWRGLGEVCLRDGRAADALIHLRRALALAPGDEELSGQIAELEGQVPPPAPPGTAGQAAGSADPVAGGGAVAGRFLVHLERWLAVLEAGPPR